MENLSNLQTILALDWKYGLVLIAAVIILAVWIIQKFDFLVGRFGIKTKKMLKEEQQEKDIEELKKHADRTDEKIDKITEAINKLGDQVEQLSIKVTECHQKNAEAERSKLGDRLTQSFRYYNEKKQMTNMEKWAFDNLVKAYKDMGGDGYIDEVVVPASLTWKIVDQ